MKTCILATGDFQLLQRERHVFDTGDFHIAGQTEVAALGKHRLFPEFLVTQSSRPFPILTWADGDRLMRAK